MYKIIWVALLAITSQTAMSEQLNGKKPICASYSALKEIVTALHNKDQRQVEALIKGAECFYPKKGVEVSYIRTIGIVDEIRMYVGNDSLVVFTSQGAYE